ncbi:MAG: hypothetical protein WCG28_02935, partial [bacterium]
ICNTGDPGCDAPINVGGVAQHKSGSLAIGKTSDSTAGYALDVPNLANFGGLVTQAFTMPTGAGAGKVLTSASDGTASWQTPATGGVGGTSGTQCDNTVHWLARADTVGASSSFGGLIFQNTTGNPIQVTSGISGLMFSNPNVGVISMSSQKDFAEFFSFTYRKPSLGPDYGMVGAVAQYGTTARTSSAVIPPDYYFVINSLNYDYDSFGYYVQLCGGGGSTDGLTQYKQHRGISGFPSYIECDNASVSPAGKLLLTVEETGIPNYFGTGDTVIYGNPSGTGTAGDISAVYGKSDGSLRKITISGTGNGGQGYSSFNCPLSVHTDGSTQIEYYSY